MATAEQNADNLTTLDLLRIEAERRRRKKQEVARPVFYGAARWIQETEVGEGVLAGPAGTGKSIACLNKVHQCMLDYPGARALIVRKTRESLSESALVTYEQYILGVDNPIVGGRQRNIRQSYKYPNGSVVNVGGIDKASKIMSTEYDIIYVQEATELTETDWESLSTRLRNGRMPFQQLIGDCNPDAPTHWLRRRADAGKCMMIDSKHEDNPRLWDRIREEWTEFGKSYMAKLDALTGVRYARLRLGKWVGAEGAVYEEWDRSKHIIGWKELPGGVIPYGWRRVRVVDFGYTNPFVTLWGALDHDGRLYIYREIYMSQRTVRDHCRQIVALSAGEEIEATVADHDAEDRATMLQEGIGTVPADKRVRVGIDAVKARLRPGLDGRPRLFFLEDALVAEDPNLVENLLPTRTVQEMDGYVWAKGNDDLNAKEVPVKKNDHGLDALRYLCMYVDGPPAVMEAMPPELQETLLNFSGL